MAANRNGAETLSTAVRAGYDRWAGMYRDRDPSTELDEPVVAELCRRLRGRCVADLGCGTGRYARLLTRLGARVIGLDLSRRMLETARQRLRSPHVAWVQADLLALPLRDQSVDGVTCGLVVDHVPNLPRMLSQAARVLRPGGLLVLTAVHPEAQRRRGPAVRFVDTAGRQQEIPAVVHEVEHVDLALSDCGFEQTHRQTLRVDARLIARHPEWRGRLGESALVIWTGERRS